MSNLTKYAQLTSKLIKANNVRNLASAVSPQLSNPKIEYTKVIIIFLFFLKFLFQFKFKKKQLFINNNFVESASGKTFETVNPSNGKVIANVSEADVVS